MQFINLKAQYQQLKSGINKRINEVLEHGQYIMGPEVRELEQQLASYVGVKHCVTVANGTDALLIAMLALGIKPGDEVITTPFTFIANGEMIALLGAIPVFVDIDPVTYNIDTNKISAAITNKTKCIMPVSLYGQCSDMNAINLIAAQHNLPVIEDAAQSFGAIYQNKKSCQLSTIACTSFFPTKPLGCYGDGGACFTDDDELALKMQRIRVHGQDKRYSHVLLGMNSRLDTLQAAILLEKLLVFDNEINSRIKIAKRYDLLLNDKIKKIEVLPGNTCVYAQYTIEVPMRDKVRESMQQNNIPTAVHYPTLLNAQAVFANHPQKNTSFPLAEHAAKTVMSLPMHPYLTEEEQNLVTNCLLEALNVCQEVNA